MRRAFSPNMQLPPLTSSRPGRRIRRCCRTSSSCTFTTSPTSFRTYGWAPMADLVTRACHSIGPSPGGGLRFSSGKGSRRQASPWSPADWCSLRTPTSMTSPNSSSCVSIVAPAWGEGQRCRSGGACQVGGCCACPRRIAVRSRSGAVSWRSSTMATSSAAPVSSDRPRGRSSSSRSPHGSRLGCAGRRRQWRVPQAMQTAASAGSVIFPSPGPPPAPKLPR
jgi:hypothetical protein